MQRCLTEFKSDRKWFANKNYLKNSHSLGRRQRGDQTREAKSLSLQRSRAEVNSNLFSEVSFLFINSLSPSHEEFASLFVLFFKLNFSHASLGYLPFFLANRKIPEIIPASRSRPRGNPHSFLDLGIPPSRNSFSGSPGGIAS